jgi:hypothetical protein
MFRQQSGLIEPALEQTLGVERNWNNQLDPVQPA